jgi:hypothetical protein
MQGRGLIEQRGIRALDVSYYRRKGRDTSILWAGNVSGANISPQGCCVALLLQVLHGKLATANVRGWLAAAAATAAVPNVASSILVEGMEAGAG